MSYIVSFGDYNFPDRGIHLEANFADTVPRTTRLPGMDGGYDEFGDDPAPSEIGRVNARLRLNASGGSAMQAARDELRGLAAIGRGSLVMQPSGGTAAYAPRWAWARINSVSIPEKMPIITDAVQDASIDWQVSDSRWYSMELVSPGGQECAGTATDFQGTAGGNAIAYPMITVTASGTLPNGFTLQRLVDAVVVDEIEYGEALDDEDEVVVDCRALSVTLNGAEAYGTAFVPLHPAWMRLLPGSNDLRVALNSGGSAEVTVEWYDTWY